MAEIDFSVSFAGMADLDWIAQNDFHIPKQTTKEVVFFRAGRVPAGVDDYGGLGE